MITERQLIKIYFNGNLKYPSIEICGDSAGLLDLATLFLSGQATVVAGDKTPSKFYPIVLDELALKPLPDPEALMEIAIQERQLVLRAGTSTAQKVGQSIQNVFSGEVREGTHFHLNYFEGNGLIAPTKYELIFQYDADTA